MRDDVNKRIGKRMLETWRRTGVFPTSRLSDSPGFWAWFRRATGVNMAMQAVETLGDRLKSMLGATHAHLLVHVNATLRHGSGCVIQGVFAYASGQMPLDRAREMAETLRSEGYSVSLAPNIPNVFDSLLRAHEERRRRHHGDPEPEVLTPTASLGERMRLFNLTPARLTLAQLRGEEPLPEGVQVDRVRPSVPSLRTELMPTYRPAFGM